MWRDIFASYEILWWLLLIASFAVNRCHWWNKFTFLFFYKAQFHWANAFHCREFILAVDKTWGWEYKKKIILGDRFSGRKMQDHIWKCWYLERGENFSRYMKFKNKGFVVFFHVLGRGGGGIVSECFFTHLKYWYIAFLVLRYFFFSDSFYDCQQDSLHKNNICNS